jgi:hypothetical protein
MVDTTTEEPTTMEEITIMVATSTVVAITTAVEIIMQVEATEHAVALLITDELEQVADKKQPYN